MMPIYSTPVRDTRYVPDTVFGLAQRGDPEGFGSATSDMAEAVPTEDARIVAGGVLRDTGSLCRKIESGAAAVMALRVEAF